MRGSQARGREVRREESEMIQKKGEAAASPALRKVGALAAKHTCREVKAGAVTHGRQGA